jgi:hypothetical protein
MLSSTRTLRFRRASRHFRPTRWHSAKAGAGPETGQHQRGPVRQGQVVLDRRGQVLHGQVRLAGGQRGHAQGVPGRAEAGDAEAADHGQVRVRAQQLVGPGRHVGFLEQVGRLDHAVHRDQPGAGPGQRAQVGAAQPGQ